VGSQKHKIKRQILELSLPEEGRAHPLMAVFKRLTYEYFLPELERMFDQVVDDDQVLQIEQLELDLGLVHPENIVEEAKSSFQRELLNIDFQLIPAQRGNANKKSEIDPETSQQRISKAERDLQRLRHYLCYGFCDWSSNGEDFRGISKTIDHLFEVNPKTIVQLVREIGSLPGVARRLVNRLKADQIESLMESILGNEYGNYKDFLFTIREWFKTVLPSKTDSIQRIGREMGIRAVAGGTPFKLWSEVFFTQFWKSLTQESDHGFGVLADAFFTWQNEKTSIGFPVWKKRLESWSMGISSQLKNEQKDLSSGEVNSPNHTSLTPPALGSDSKFEGESKQKAKNNRRGRDKWNEGPIREEKELEQPDVTDSQSQKPFPTSQTTKFNSGSFTSQPEFYLKNAGMVLLWPFFQGVFRDLGFLNGENVFQNESLKERAALWLQFMTTGLEELPEEELVLNKILVGLPVEFPISPHFIPTEKEKEVAELTLRSAITHWKSLRNMSTNGFRGNYLLRPGILRWKAPVWRLLVEGRPYDMLMAQMPWGISLIRLPWLHEMMEVQWK